MRPQISLIARLLFRGKRKLRIPPTGGKSFPVCFGVKEPLLPARQEGFFGFSRPFPRRPGPPGQGRDGFSRR